MPDAVGRYSVLGRWTAFPDEFISRRWPPARPSRQGHRPRMGSGGMSGSIDSARLKLLLNNLRLPAIRQGCSALAERADKEACPSSRYDPISVGGLPALPRAGVRLGGPGFGRRHRAASL